MENPNPVVRDGVVRNRIVRDGVFRNGAFRNLNVHAVTFGWIAILGCLLAACSQAPQGVGDDSEGGSASSESRAESLMASIPGLHEPLADLDRGTIRFHGQVGVSPCPAPEIDRASVQGPNVLLIVVDTLRADRLGFMGHDRDTSPYLDALAADSLVFEHAIAPAPWTTPSMAGLFTGMPPAALGIRHQPIPLPAEIQTISELLQKRGYLTAGIASHFYIGEKYGFHRGFDIWDETAAGGHEDISSPWVTGLAGNCLQTLAKEDRPFFLFTHYFDPHYDYLEHGPYVFSGAYEGPARSRDDNFEDLRFLAKNGRLSEEDLGHLKDLYDSEIAFTDEHVGRLLGRLKQLGLYDSTLIVFVADHGEMFGERHRWIGHTKYLYEELIHVPLIIKPAGPPSGRRVEATVSTLAVLPTILDQVGSELPIARSLIGLGAGEEPPVVFSQTRRWRKEDAVYQGDWKLLHDGQTYQYQLFNLREDPGETTDQGRARRQTLIAMRNALEAWQAQVDATAAGLKDREAPDLTAEEQERLRALGYID